MKKNNVKNAIIWAALMLSTSYLLKGVGDNNQFMILILQIIGWVITDQLIRDSAKQNKEGK